MTGKSQGNAMRRLGKTLTMAGILLGVLTLGGGAWGMDGKTFSVEPGTVLKIDNQNGDIDISGWDRNEIEVDTVRQGKPLFSKEQPTIDISTGKEFVIRTVYSSVLAMSARIHYRIKVPKGVLVTDVVGSNGAIRVENVSGDVNAKTSNGHIQLTKVNGFVKAVTSNGQINVAEVDGLGEARNSAQDIYVEVPAIRDNLKISSNSGSITVLLSPDISARLEAGTFSGDVTCRDLPLTTNESSQRRITGRLGEGGGLVSIKTISGSITLRKLGSSSPK